MAGEYSRFFGGPAGSVPSYTQPNFAEVLQRVFSNGVFTGVANALAVTETDPVSLAVSVNTGEGWINGFWYQNSAALVKSLSAADVTNPRIDCIVLRLDTVTNYKISVEVLEGTPAGSPAAPALTQNASTWEISLAQVLVAANATSVANAVITDKRNYIYAKEAIKSGDNILLNPGFQVGATANLPLYWTAYQTPTLALVADTLFPALGGNQLTITGTGAASEGIRASVWLLIKPSTTYTFSVDYKVTAGDNLRVWITSFNGVTQGTTHIDVTTLNSTTAVRYTCTFTTDANANNLMIQLLAVADGDIVIVSHPKIEEGSVATPFEPCHINGWQDATLTFSVAAYDDSAGGQPTTTSCRFKIEGHQCTVQYKGNGTKAGAGRTMSFTAAVLPPIGAAVASNTCVGSGWINISSSIIQPVMVVVASATAFGLYTEASIADNAVIANFSFTMTYEI